MDTLLLSLPRRSSPAAAQPTLEQAISSAVISLEVRSAMIADPGAGKYLRRVLQLLDDAFNELGHATTHSRGAHILVKRELLAPYWADRA